MCFVIQPFDGADFDLRYEDVLKPAIEAAGFRAYRVDQDPTVVIPIDEIHEKIERADAIVADITLDNPNVWYELGYAIALGHDPLMIRQENTESGFPFDVRHRRVVTYQTTSRTHFDQLSDELTEGLRAGTRRQRSLPRARAEQNRNTGDSSLDADEIDLLVYLGNSDADGDPQSRWEMNKRGREFGRSALHTKFALDHLVSRGLVEQFTAGGEYQDEYEAFRPTPIGYDMLSDNRDLWDLKAETTARASAAPAYNPDEEPF